MKSFGLSKQFIFGDGVEWEAEDKVLKREIILNKVDFQVGAKTAHVEDGEYKLIIGSKVRTVKGGNCFNITPNIVYGAVCTPVEC